MRRRLATLTALLVLGCGGSGGRDAGDEPDADLPDVQDTAEAEPVEEADAPEDTVTEEILDTVEEETAETEAPEFGGLWAAWPCDGRVVLEWKEATDESPPVTYRVYAREEGGSYAWDSPVAETTETRASVTGLSNGVLHYFVVRASDALGNEDENLVEIAVTPRIAYPTLPLYERIYEPDPVLLPSCHSSCIVELHGGELMTIWYCGTSEHSDDVAIWGSHRLADADAWTAPEIVQDTPGLPDGNDVLYLGDDGRLWLFWALQETFDWSTAVIKVKVSHDLGRSWGPVFDLGTPPGYLPRTHPKRLDNGWIIVPLYVEYTASSVLVRSETGGATWEEPTTILSFLGTQPTVIQRSDGSLFALMRSGAPPQKSWQAASTDRGISWGSRSLSALDNPGSSLEMVMLASGSVAVAFNNSTTSRSNLSLGISHDEGATWPTIRAVEDHTEGGYDYPSIIQDACGFIHLSYSWNSRTSIAHFVTDEAWIESAP